MADQDTVFASTHPVILGFPVLTAGQFDRAVKFREEQARKGNNQMREVGYEATAIMPETHPDIPSMRQIIKAVAADHFKTDEVQRLIAELADKHGRDPATVKWQAPLKSGTKMADKRKAKLEKMNKKPDQEYLRDQVLLVARSKFPVSLAYMDRGKIIDLDTEELRAANSKRFEAGYEALFQVKFAWYNPSLLVLGGGVNAFLQLVMVTGKGTPFYAGRSAKDAFKGYAGKMTDEDPLGGRELEDLDDEIPF